MDENVSDTSKQDEFGHLLRRIETLREWDKNPREISEKKFTDLKTYYKKLLDDGRPLQTIPLVIETDGTVLDGNHRLKVFRELGIEWVWVEIVSPRSDAERWDIVLASNAKAAHYDEDALNNVMPEFENDLDLNIYPVSFKEEKSITELLDQQEKAAEKSQKKAEEEAKSAIFNCPHCGGPIVKKTLQPPAE